jgi:hypothetical protein
MVFAPNDTGGERNVKWAAGSVYFADGTTQSINAGNSGTLATNDTFWIYATVGSATLAVTSSISTAYGANKIAVAIVRTTDALLGDGTEKITVIPRWGEGTTLSAAAAVVGVLSAFTADIGEVTAGTITGLLIRTASSGQRIEMTSTVFKTIDSGGETRIEIPTTADKINFYDSGGTLRGSIEGWGTGTTGLLVEVKDRLRLEDSDDNDGITVDTTDHKIHFYGTLYDTWDIYNSSLGSTRLRNGANSSTLIEWGASGNNNLGFYGATPITQRTGWTTADYSTDRSIDADSDTLEQVADALCTLVEDLKDLGIIGA